VKFGRNLKLDSIEKLLSKIVKGNKNGERKDKNVGSKTC